MKEDFTRLEGTSHREEYEKACACSFIHDFYPITTPFDPWWSCHWQNELCPSIFQAPIQPQLRGKELIQKTVLYVLYLDQPGNSHNSNSNSNS